LRCIKTDHSLFRIRRIADGFTPANARALQEVEAILAARFSAARKEDITGLERKLARPAQQGMAPIVLVAEDAALRIRGCILAYRFIKPSFLFLDYLATVPGRSGGGVGGALYQRLREIAAGLGLALFFEVLPGDAAHCKLIAEELEENRRRLAFYARFGAYPIAGTLYETPLSDSDSCPPHLVFDGCGVLETLRASFCREVMRALLERKYGALCPPDYNRKVLASIREDPVSLARPPRLRALVKPADGHRRLALIVNQGHEIFHVRERGYVEAPVRISSILDGLSGSVAVERIEARHFPDAHVAAVHDPALIAFIRNLSASMPAGKSTYPYVFPIRNREKPPKDLALLAGYFCIDTFTPINANCWPAARGAADCALTAAALCLEERRFSYALVRPPGHHAERRAFGGFCYLNNAAIAANYLSRYGRVAVLDIDYHHGNGTQEIFYARTDVLTVSIHGHPSFAYPYFSGFADETGSGAGVHFNLNLPLEEHAGVDSFMRALGVALKRIGSFDPHYLVVALGFDTAASDPTGSWKLRPGDFQTVGKAIAALGRPTAFIQEGGYRTRTLGRNAAAFFTGVLGP
jgi:acetoin utilization deacetylase AcuC-like enzyme/GNAT superfamily N-acetyltransferase